ncbi:Ankyrin repeat and EF-hand [Maublancomyces gigas]|uniref:Ankyrin repeat and EF-hand n=1 Tax=Discina gigas TaxID=1032678 RepID=A0ABR3G5B7_9PEZI
MNDIPRGTSRAKLTRFLLAQSRSPSTTLHLETQPQVVFGCDIVDSRLDDELSVATIEFSDTPPWLQSQDPYEFPKHTQLGTIWCDVDRLSIDAHGQTEFIRAVRNYHSRQGLLFVETLAEFPDTDVNVQDEHGRTALHWACAESLQEMVALCLSIPDIDTGLRDKDNLTAFDIARRTGGGDSIANSFYRSILEIEEARPQAALLRVLTLSSDESSSANKPLFPGKALFQPVGERNSPLVIALLDRGVELTTKDEAGDTALHIAAGFADNVEVVTRLLKAGADINAVGNRGATPLHSAVHTADVAMVQLLVYWNADIALTDDEQMSALDRAVKTRKLDVERVLVQEVADPVSRASSRRLVLEMPAAEHSIAHASNVPQDIPVISSLPPRIIENNPHIGITLLEAAGKGDLDGIRAILARGYDTSEVDEYYQNALHYAAKGGHLQIVKELLAAGAEIEAQDRDSGRPLHRAASNGHLEIVKELLAAGADIEARDQFSRRPLHHSELLAAGAEIEAQDQFSRRPLHHAAIGGHLEIVKELLAAGAEIEAPGQFNERPLHHAAEGGHLKIVKELLAAGAEIDARGINSERPLHYAAKGGHLEMVKELLAAGAEIEAQDRFQNRSLHHVAGGGDLKIVKELLAAGAEIEAPSQFNERPLHRAAKGGHLKIVKELLAAGAEIEARGNNSERPLHYAARGGHLEMVKELLAAGAEIEARGNNSERPLHYAARGAHLEIVKELLAAGAESLARSKYGKTASDIASEHEQRHVLKILNAHTSTADRVKSKVRYRLGLDPVNKGSLS